MLLYGGGAVLVLAVLLLLFVVGGDKNRPQTVAPGTTPAAASATNAAAPEKDTLESLESAYREAHPRTAQEMDSFAKRFVALGSDDGKEEARRIYQEVIDQKAVDDLEARKFLGYTDFQTDILKKKLEPGGDPIPEEIFNRHGYDYLDAVVQFNAERWLTDPDEIQQAKKAVQLMNDHVDKLLHDHEFRAADQIRANIASNPKLAPYNYATRWAAPYLICYSSKDRLSEFDLLKIADRKKRKEKLEQFREQRQKWERVLDEKALLYTQLYKEYMRRFGKAFGLKDLSAEYGGRPDYGSYKTFKDGVPLVIWIFTDHEAFIKYHEEVMGDNTVPTFAAGYFSPKTAWVYLYDESDTSSDRVFEINKNLHEGTHQLEYWFTRQLNKWREPKFSQSAWSEGIAEYMGSVEMDKARHLTWTGVNQTRLGNMQAVAKTFKSRGNREYPIFPIERLAAFESYGQVGRWGMQEWKLPFEAVMGLFYQQVWAFVYFLNDFQNGKYRDKWLQFYNADLLRETGGGASQQVFKRIFHIRDEEDWDGIEKDWEGFIRNDLMHRDMSKIVYTPPGRDDWPDKGKGDKDDAGK